MSLFWRVFAINAVVLVVAAVLLLVTPATVSPEVRVVEVLVVAGGVVAALAVNLVLMRRAFAPLERLAQLMGRVDPLQPGPRGGGRAPAGGRRRISGVQRDAGSAGGRAP
jgi:two-component system sensor histidine kinase UhpB